MSNGRCRLHGGASLSGLASPSLKTGRYSKHLPTRMLANYEAAKSDPELLALQDEVSLIDARLADLLQRVGTGEAGETWRSVRETYQKLRTAIARKNIVEMSALINELGVLVATGDQDEAVWEDIRACIEQRRRLVESERKRLVDMQQMVNADQAVLMVRSLVASVRQHVHDPATLRAISDDLARLAVARTD